MKKRTICIFFSLFLIAGLIGCKPAEQPAHKAEEAVKHEVHWGYEGEGAPAHWGTLKPEFELCGTGMSQSPIDLTKAFKADLMGYDTYSFPFEGEVEIDIFLAGPRVSSDLDNHAKQVLDALVEAGVIKDDDCRTVVQLRVRRQLHVPKKNRYTMVRVCPWVRE